MDKAFIEQVEQALNLVRKEDLTALGQLEVSKCPLIDTFLRDEYGDTDMKSVAPDSRGKAVFDFFINLIDELKPVVRQNEPQSRDWQIYSLLRKFYFLKMPRPQVEDELVISKTFFYDLRRDGIKKVALAWWNWETALSRQPSGVKGNWDEIPEPYTRFIRRRHPESQEYYDELIVEELATGKAWVITLVGGAGVGKTALAYRVGSICYNRELFNAIVGIPLKGELLNPWTGKVLKTSQVDRVLMHFYESLGIALNERKVLTVLSLEEKKAIDLKALCRYRKVLIILDNLEILLGKTPSQEAAFQHIQEFFYELPRGCKILATSRGRPHMGERQLPIRGMQREEALEFAREVMSSRSIVPFPDHIFASICEATEGLPLQIQRTIARMVLYQEPLEEALQRRGEEELEYMYYDVEPRLSDRQRFILFVIQAAPDSVLVDSIAEVSSVPRFLVEPALEELAFQTLIQGQTVEHPKGTYDLYRITPQFQTYLWSTYRSEESFLGSRLSTSLDQVLELWAKHFHETLVNPPPYLRLEGQSIVDSRILFLKTQKNNVFYVMKWLYQKFEEGHEREDGQLFMDLMLLLGHSLGLLGYKEKKIELGANASNIALVLGNERLAAQFEVYDVIWSLQRWPEPDTELVMQKLNANLGEAIKRWPDPGPKLVTRKLEANLEEAMKEKWPEIEALALRQLGKHLRDEGFLRESLAQLEKSREIFQDLGKNGKREAGIDAASGVVSMRSNIGDLKLLMEDYAGARDSLKEIVTKRQTLAVSKGEFIEVLCSLAVTCYLDGSEDEAKRYFDEARRELRSINPVAPCWAYYYFQLGQLDQLKGIYESAKRNYEQAKEVLLKLGMELSARYERVEQAIASLDRAE